MFADEMRIVIFEVAEYNGEAEILSVLFRRPLFCG